MNQQNQVRNWKLHSTLEHFSCSRDLCNGFGGLIKKQQHDWNRCFLWTLLVNRLFSFSEGLKAGTLLVLNI